METEGGHRGGLKGSAGHGRGRSLLFCPPLFPLWLNLAIFFCCSFWCPLKSFYLRPLVPKPSQPAFISPFPSNYIHSLPYFLPRLSSTSLFSSIPLPIPSLFPALSGLLLCHPKPALSALISAQSPALRELNISAEAPPAAT